jgi:hypothetical protein
MAETKNITKTSTRISGAPVPLIRNTAEAPPQKAVIRATVFFINLNTLVENKI